MKPALLTLLFLLSVFTTKTPPSEAANPEPVLDISGQKLRAGVSYHILPATGSGSLSLAPFANDTCPLLVVQENIGSSKNYPVIFSPANAKHHVIFTSRNLNIKFSSSASICGTSMVWRLLKRITEARFISTDGVEGNPSFNTLVNWFMIEKADVGYSLKFCPTEICKCSVVCSELGIVKVGDDKKRYLGLADSQVTPLRVVFKKAVGVKISHYV